MIWIKYNKIKETLVTANDVDLAPSEFRIFCSYALDLNPYNSRIKEVIKTKPNLGIFRLAESVADYSFGKFNKKSIVRIALSYAKYR